MKKFTIILIALIFTASTVFAMTPYFDPFYTTDDIFTSPARFTEQPEISPFGFEINTFGAVDYLSYLSNPVNKLSEDEYVDALYDILYNADLDFWSKNSTLLSSVFDFDGFTWTAPTNEAQLAQLQADLEASFNDRFDSTHKAVAVYNAIQNDLLDDEKLYSDVNLSLSLHGGASYSNGFAWRIKADAGFMTPENMLSNQKSVIAFDVRADVAYAFNILSEKFSVGVALDVLAGGQARISNNGLLAARFEDNILLAFTDDPNFTLDMGLGFGLNFGGMYRQNETLAFTLDLTNVASFRKYYYLDVNDLSGSYDGFDEMDVYYQPMDLVLKALWDYGPYHLVVEFSDVINQVIWDREVSGYDYNFFAIPKLGFTYDINEDFSINTHLGYSKLSFGIDFHNFTVEASTSLNKLGFGLSVGYSI